MANQKIFEFDELNLDTPLVIDAIYKGGNRKNSSDDPFHPLLGVGNQGGFRKSRMKGTDDYAFIVLYTTGSEIEWPDFLDLETGIFRYFGDNRTYGKDLLDTKAGGNKTLHEVFSKTDTEEGRRHVPPFLLFEKDISGRDVKFLGMAAPGMIGPSGEKDLIAFWRTIDGNRFQNYEAHFTVLDCNIPKNWLIARQQNTPGHEDLAPKEWTDFVVSGKAAIKPLISEYPSHNVPSKNEQLPSDEEGRKLIASIRAHYSNDPTAFEKCAIHIIPMIDDHFRDFKLTRKTRDGGRDAICRYRIGRVGSDYPLELSCAIEAKLYSEDHGVPVRYTSRLISRIKNKEFGVLITTSYVDRQAYSEILEDGHPILMVTAKEIAEVLMYNGINTQNVISWLKTVDKNKTDYILE